MASRVILMCGPAGSGKSTVAQELASAHGYVRLSFDARAWRLGQRQHPIPDDVSARVDAAIRGRLVALVRVGCDVVVDAAFAVRRRRDEYRELLAPLGVVPEVYYLATRRDVVLERMATRDNASADSIALSKTLAESYFDGFEVPTADEGPLRIFGRGT